MAEEEPADKRAESLRELAELMSKPDVAKFLARSTELGTTLTTGAAAICDGCCLLFGGGRRAQLT